MERARLSPSFLLLLLLLQPGGYSGATTDDEELTGILGGSVTFPLRIPAPQKLKHAAWMVNTSTSIATVTGGNPPRLRVFHPAFEGRLRVPEQSHSLQLRSLRTEDTGSYSVEFSTDTEDFVYREFTLRVSKGQLPPTIACDSVACENDACSYTLHCAIRDGGENVSYSWSHTPSHIISRVSVVHIRQRHQAAHENFTCTAHLPDGNSSSTVSPKDVCTEQVPETMIICDSVRCAHGACNYTLRCIARERGGNVGYTWTRGPRGAVVSTGPVLQFSLRPFEDLPAVTCTARHPASNSSRTVSSMELCPDIASQPSLASSLSYGHVGLLLVLVLGTGVVA
ncbi:SLAM family member 9-like isoform X1 [Pelodiscus sinensis]|uniref:SLAM family member 9-like isoform X1 n=2 Tax=Pelodiscus sinensis TaxID=13735 RepID=UPI003F6CA88F